MLERLLQRHLQIRRDHFCQPITLAVGQSHHPPHVTDDRLRAHRAEGDDLRHRLPPIFLPDILDHVGAAVVGEVNVYVRRVDPLRIEETLEEQSVSDRANVGYFQQIGDNRASRRAARPAGNAALMAVADEVPNDQEVAKEPGLLDDLEFKLQPVNDCLDGRGDGRT